jgi:hypothetical protein
MIGCGRVSKKGVPQGDVSGGAHNSLLRNHTSPVLRGELRLGGSHSRAISRGGRTVAGGATVTRRGGWLRRISAGLLQMNVKSLLSWNKMGPLYRRP